MRIASGLACVYLILFAAIQYDDPDPWRWGAIYGVASLWCGVAAFRPVALRRPAVRWAFLASVAAALAGLVWYWPQAPGWWRRAVWWEDETAREGMGMMIVVVSLLVAAAAARLRPR